MKIIWVIMSLTAAVSNSARAATIVQHIESYRDGPVQFFPEIPAGTPQYFGSFALFDPQLGMLNKVTVALSLQLAVGRLINLDDPATLTTSGHASAYAGYGPPVPAMLSNPFPFIDFGSSTRTLFGIGGSAYTINRAFGSATSVFTSELSSYVGTTTAQIFGKNTVLDLKVRNDRTGFEYTETFAQPAYRLIADITYEYSTLSAVPEPASWAFFVMSFAVVGLASRLRLVRANGEIMTVQALKSKHAVPVRRA